MTTSTRRVSARSGPSRLLGISGLIVGLMASPTMAADVTVGSGYGEGELIEQIIERSDYDLPSNFVCGHSVDDIVLFEYGPNVEWVIEAPDEQTYLFEELEPSDVQLGVPLGIPTIPARTPMFFCITGETLAYNDIPPPPEYCCY